MAPGRGRKESGLTPDVEPRRGSTRRQLLASTAALSAGLSSPLWVRHVLARDEGRGANSERRLDEARREGIRRGCIFLAGEDGKSGKLRKDGGFGKSDQGVVCLLYTSDAADDFAVV